MDITTQQQRIEARTELIRKWLSLPDWDFEGHNKLWEDNKMLDLEDEVNDE